MDSHVFLLDLRYSTWSGIDALVYRQSWLATNRQCSISPNTRSSLVRDSRGPQRDHGAEWAEPFVFLPASSVRVYSFRAASYKKV